MTPEERVAREILDECVTIGDSGELILEVSRATAIVELYGAECERRGRDTILQAIYGDKHGAVVLPDDVSRKIETAIRRQSQP